MTRLIIFLTILIASLNAFSTGYRIEFKAIDLNSEPQPFTTVTLFLMPDSINLYRCGTTDTDGHFVTSLDRAGQYRISLTAFAKVPKTIDISITDDTHLGNIILDNSTIELNSVEVTSLRSPVSTKSDRLIYNVSVDSDSKTLSLLEILRKVPLVSVDNRNNILLKGQTDFRIFKNGKPNPAWEKNARDILASIPASMIKRIEVITEPGAGYDAEGTAGIINIITGNETAARGMMGNIRLNADERGGIGTNIFATAQYGKLLISPNYSLSYNPPGFWKQERYTEYNYTESRQQRQYRSVNDDNQSTMHNFSLAASYETDTLNLFSFEFRGSFPDYQFTNYAATTLYNPRGDLISSYNTHSLYPQYRFTSFGGQLDYQHLTRTRGEAITLSYMFGADSEEIDSHNRYNEFTGIPEFDYDTYTAYQKQNSWEHTFQLDWCRPISQNQHLNLGLKYILRRNFSDNKQQYLLDGQHSPTAPADNTERFEHDAHIAAAYGEYSIHGTNWSARAGLRYEYTFNDVRYPDTATPASTDFHNHMNDIVPAAGASYRFNDTHTVNLNYSTRIKRPSIFYLNPALIMTPTTATQGAPDLRSVAMHNIASTYSILRPKVAFNISGSFSFSRNGIMEYSYLRDNLIWTQYGNIGRTISAGIHFYARYTPFKGTAVTANAGTDYSTISRRGSDEHNSGWGMNIYADISQQIIWGIRLSAFGAYTRSSTTTLYCITPRTSYYYGLNIMKSFMHDDRMTARLGINTPCPGWQKTTYADKTPTYDTITHIRYSGPKIELTLSLRIGALDANVKKADKTIINDDLQKK